MEAPPLSFGAQVSPRPPDWVVTAEIMRAIEGAMFEAGMPVAALMEKVAQRLAAWVMAHYPPSAYPQVGVLVGPGHNGGDALVVARELASAGYGVQIISPFDRHKSLTADHLRYARALGLPILTTLPHPDPQPDGASQTHGKPPAQDDPSFPLQESQPQMLLPQGVSLWIDGLFGFGLERPIVGDLADWVTAINAHPAPVVSLDLPSGLHTDTGHVLGIAIRATHTLCIGLWKRAFCQDVALPYLGQSHLIAVDIPAFALAAGLENVEPENRFPARCLTAAEALAGLPLPRAVNTHKYRVGQLLLVAGSRQYAGAAILAGLGARASGVGMLTLAVPESLRLTVVAQLPEALVIGCPETEIGTIAQFPEDLASSLGRYDAVACGPGLSRQVGTIVEALVAADCALLLDADALNLLAERDPISVLTQRSAPTILTPHLGEFKRLFPRLAAQIADQFLDAGAAAQAAAAQAQSLVVLKGACTALAHPDGRLWFNTESTPGLARGGSGDVLTGLMGGLLAQSMAQVSSESSRAQGDFSHDPSHNRPVLQNSRWNLALNAALAGVWWHSQTARDVATDYTEFGVDGPRLAAALTPTLSHRLKGA